MKLNESLLIPAQPESEYDRRLQQALLPFLRATALKVNQLADSRFAGLDDVRTGPPTTGTWVQGDQIRNSAPAELGTTPNKYVIEGWICVASGTPGTWVQKRTLTGN